MNTHIYISISLSLSLSVYIYIYIHMTICLYVYTGHAPRSAADSGVRRKRASSAAARRLDKGVALVAELSGSFQVDRGGKANYSNRRRRRSCCMPLK